jgi:hypothetical protein
MLKTVMASAAVMVAATAMLAAQTPPASPDGKVQVEVGGKYVAGARGQSYQGGKWLEITYSRPNLRGRDTIFGAGADYGKDLLAGAPVWRAGANVSTRLKTPVALTIGGKTVPAGEYSIFIDLKENNWTFILSSYGAAATGGAADKANLWGAYNYTSDKDVVRAPMKHSKNTMSVEALTWGVVNVTPTGGEFAIWWGKEIATVPFTLHVTAP